MTYRIHCRAGGIHWTAGEHDTLGAAMDRQRAVWQHYHQRVNASRRHPPVTIWIEDTQRGIALMSRRADRPRPEPDGDPVSVRVRGIPATAYVTAYSPGTPARRGLHCGRTGALIDPGEPPEPPEVEYDLRDRRGYPAPWLERMMGGDDWDAVTGQVLSSAGRAPDLDAQKSTS